MKTEETNLQLVKRPADARGLTDISWLHSRHSFSFGEYYDPSNMGFSALRVINDDIVKPGMGFGMHPHRNAEIFTYVISGQLQHKDSMGNGSVIGAGNLQYMSAGSGVQHSEFNPSPAEPVHLLQIWLLPSVQGGAPRYAEKPLGDVAPNTTTLLFSEDGREGSLAIRQRADISFARVGAGGSVPFALPQHPLAYIHVIKGRVQIGDENFSAGDAAEISVQNGSTEFEIGGLEDSDLLIFALPASAPRIA